LVGADETLLLGVMLMLGLVEERSVAQKPTIDV